MIVVVGSRHDPIATELAAGWPDGELCSAEDLTRPGWVWSSGPDQGGPSRWVVEGAVVDDSQVTGVFVRRATVYAEELSTTHPDDRDYLAAEAHAFLVHVLHRTGATVVNPVDDGGAFGEAALRPEHWMAVATSLAVPVAPLRMRSQHRPRPATATVLVEVVDGVAIGAPSGPLGEAAAVVCRGVGLRWAVAAFDDRERLSALTTSRPPSPRGCHPARATPGHETSSVILVWGPAHDPPTIRMLEVLDEAGVDAVHLDDVDLPTLRYDLRLGRRPSGWVEVDGRQVSVGQIDGIYLRPGESRADSTSTAAALLAVAGSAPAVVVNRPTAGRSNLSKPFQLSLLTRAGLATPDTLVTSDADAARAFLARHGRLIYKSISGCRSIVAAIGADEADELDRVGHGPVQLQEWVDGLDVRVHVVGHQWFASSVTSTATDYRYASNVGADVAVAPFELPLPLGRQMVDVARSMGLLVAGVDLRRTPEGRWYCFEVNPSPGFTYYEQHTGQPIAAAIGDLLTAGHQQARSGFR